MCLSHRCLWKFCPLSIRAILENIFLELFLIWTKLAKPEAHARKAEGHIYPEILRKASNHGFKGFIVWILLTIYYQWIQGIFIRKWIDEENLAQLFICMLTVALYLLNKLFSYENDFLFSRKHQYLSNCLTGLLI